MPWTKFRKRSGKPVAELINEAIEIFVSENQLINRRVLMQKARRIWADREDFENVLIDYLGHRTTYS